MDIPLSRLMLVIALLALPVGALLLGMRADPGGARQANGTETGVVAAAASRTEALNPAAGAVPAQLRTAGPAGAAPPAARAPSSRRATLRERFERTDDLHAYLQTLLPAARSGDAEAAWMASRVYDYCAMHAMDPVAYARDTDALAGMGLAAPASMVAARERVARRCRQFVPGDGIGRELVIVQRLEAAEAGSLAAEAALLAMGEPLEEDQDYRSGLVDRVQASADPEAFSALAPAMGLAASGDPAYAAQLAGTPDAELAWQIGACQLGLDCTADGALMTSYCANGGVCSRNPRQDFQAFVQDEMPPRGGARSLNEKVGSLLGEGVRE